MKDSLFRLLFLVLFCVTKQAPASIAQVVESTTNGSDLVNRYDCIGIFQNGFAWVCKHNKFGAINRSYMEIAPCIYDEPIFFDKNGLSFVVKDSITGIIDTNGAEIAPIAFDQVNCSSCIVYDRECTVDQEPVVQVNGKYGKIDEHGQYGVQPKYDYLDCVFGGNFFTTKYNGGVGMIDYKGRERIPFKYCGIGEILQEGCIEVLGTNSKWGLVDTSGCIVLSFIYDNNIWKEIGGYRNAKARRLLLVGSPLVDTNHNSYKAVHIDTVAGEMIKRLKMGRYWGVVDSVGRQIAPPIYDTIYKFTGTVAKVQLGYNWGYINSAGQAVIPADYSFVGAVYKGVVPVCSGDCRLSSIDNRRITTKQYNWIFPFINDTACVVDGNKIGFIDTLGNEIIPCQISFYGDVTELIKNKKLPEIPTYGWLNRNTDTVDNTLLTVCPKGQYTIVSHFSEGVALVSNSQYKWGVIDRNGAEVVPCIYGSLGYCNNGRIAASVHGKYGFINKTGKVLVSFKYDNAIGYTEGLAHVRLKGKYGYIDTNGMVILPFLYEYASCFSEGYAAICIDGKWGYINKSGKVVIPCRYDGAKSFSDGYAAVEVDDQWGFINKQGKIIVQCSYDDAHFFSQGIGVVQNGRKWLFIDTVGNEIMQIGADAMGCLMDSFATVEVDIRCNSLLPNRYKVINRRGVEVKFDPRYRRVEARGEGMFLATYYNGKMALLNVEGRIITEFDNATVGEFSGGIATIQMNDKWGIVDTTRKDIIWFGTYIQRR